MKCVPRGGPPCPPASATRDPAPAVGQEGAFNLTGDEAIQRRRATQLRGIERVQTAIEQFRVNRLDLHRQTIRYGLHEPDRRASLTTFVGHFINGGLPDLSKSLPHRIEVYTVEEGNSRGLTLYCKQCVDGRAGASVTVLFDGRGYACKGCGHRFVTD